MIHLTEKDYVRSQWSGGATTQLYLAPVGASYAERTFLWRVSSATVELEESDFTALPDYDRWIATLEGSITLSHGDGEAVRLAPYEVYAFDGAAHTHSLGRCTDFNLMLRKGKCRGSLRVLRLPAGAEQELLFENAPCRDFPSGAMVVYCGHGLCQLAAGKDGLTLQAGECAVVETAVVLTAKTPVDLMIAEVCY